MDSGPKKKKQFQSIYKEEALTEPGIEIHPDAKPPNLEPIPDSGDRRTTPRHPLEFETIIFHKGISFRTKTLNISLGGALLAKSIPIEFVNEELDIVLIRTEGRTRDYYLVKGMALGAPMRSPRLKFTQIEPIQRKKLEAVFKEFEITITQKIG